MNIVRKLLLLLALFVGFPAYGAVGTPVAAGAGSLGNTVAPPLVISVTTNFSVGDLLYVVTKGGSSQGATGVTDDAGNVYTCGAQITFGTTTRMRACYAILTTPLSSGQNVTIAYASANGTKQAIIAKVSNVAAFDQEGAGATGTSSSPTITTGTLASADEVIFAPIFINNGGGDTFTQDANFSQLSFNSAGGSILRLAYRVVSTNSPVTYAPTLGTSRDWFVNYQTFTGAAGAAPSGKLTTLGVGK